MQTDILSIFRQRNIFKLNPKLVKNYTKSIKFSLEQDILLEIGILWLFLTWAKIGPAGKSRLLIKELISRTL